MALTQTTLSGAISATELTLPVTSATGFTVGNPLKVDTEMIGAILAIDGTAIKVRGRGWDGTAGVAHNALAIVVTGLPSDFAAPSPGTMVALDPDEPEIKTYSVNGAITIPDRDQLIYLNKAGVAAMTLAAPSKAQDGLMLQISSTTANAHTVTATGLFKTGAATVNLATFAAFAGAGFTVRASQGLWNVVSSVAITFT
jgi:hypothetical protein